jgi:uncharacterized membrane protein YdjX (TVP38/TMEM64 family)
MTDGMTPGGRSEMTAENARQPASWIRTAMVVVALVAVFLLLRWWNVQEELLRALEWIRGLGPLGPLVFVLLYIAATVLFVPGFILTVGAGFVFGVVRGTILVSISATLGATCAFLVGRYLARDWVASRIEGNPKFKAIDEAVAREGWKIVLLTRLSPLFPFNLLNYAFGLTKVGLRDYFFASWVGMFPVTLLYVYLGSVAESLATLGSGQRQRSAGEWALFGVGLLAAVAVAVYVTRLARAALESRVGSADEAA